MSQARKQWPNSEARARRGQCVHRYVQREFGRKTGRQEQCHASGMLGNHGAFEHCFGWPKQVVDVVDARCFELSAGVGDEALQRQMRPAIIGVASVDRDEDRHARVRGVVHQFFERCIGQGCRRRGQSLPPLLENNYRYVLDSALREARLEALDPSRFLQALCGGAVCRVLYAKALGHGAAGSQLVRADAALRPWPD
ncbi:unannotated protein [freshwater metagenome]|uniref:Unannotated protein n=1 Tax=freshwater metagenome TaxID=449393 RepID=A0A6J6XW82_9ZZZZ